MDAPRWLSDEERRTWLQLRAVTMLLPAAVDGQLKRDSGISEFEFSVLAILSEARERRLTLSVLAARTNASLSRLSHVISRLGEAGWVRKTGCPNDRRSTFAVLTEEGFAQVVRAAPGHVTEVRRHLFDTMSSAERDGLSVALARILSTLDPAHHLTSEFDEPQTSGTEGTQPRRRNDARSSA